MIDAHGKLVDVHLVGAFCCTVPNVPESVVAAGSRYFSSSWREVGSVKRASMEGVGTWAIRAAPAPASRVELVGDEKMHLVAGDRPSERSAELVIAGHRGLARTVKPVASVELVIAGEVIHFAVELIGPGLGDVLHLRA